MNDREKNVVEIKVLQIMQWHTKLHQLEEWNSRQKEP